MGRRDWMVGLFAFSSPALRERGKDTTMKPEELGARGSGTDRFVWVAEVGKPPEA